MANFKFPFLLFFRKQAVQTVLTAPYYTTYSHATYTYITYCRLYYVGFTQNIRCAQISDARSPWRLHVLR